jgi:predicted ATPase/DNA-binding CsgD family transcriptional regulator
MVVPFNKPVVCPIVIGRTTELTAIHQLIESTKSGHGQVTLLSGEAGVGKSRLVKEAKAYATALNFRVVQGNCFPTDLSCPYAPLLDLIRTLLAHSDPTQIQAILKPFARDLYPLLPDVILPITDLITEQPSTALDPELEKRRIFTGLVHCFTSLATELPLMLIIEDLHWGDDTSLEFLHYLARHCADHPLLLLMTYRNDEIRPALRSWLAQLDRERLAHEYLLSSLSRYDVDAMLQAIFDIPRRVPAETLDALYGLTEGNPFFIEEILKSLISAGEIFYKNENWEHKPLNELHIPRSIQDSVQQRTDQLSKDARNVLMLAAVAGRRFDFVLLQQLIHHDEQQLLAVMKELIAAQLVVEETAEHFAFRHALTQQAIYTQLLVRERRAIHHKIAETLENLYATTLEHYVEDLAYHYYKAEVWEKALKYGQQAGDKAQALYSPRAAIEHFTQALHAAQNMTLLPSTTLYRRRGHAYATLGDFEQAQSDYKQALDIAQNTHDGAEEWQSVIDLGFLWAERDYEQAGRYYHQAIELARTLDDPKLESHSLNRMGNWHLNIEQSLEALHYHHQALTIFQELHDQHGIAETLDLLGMTSYLGGDLVSGTGYYKQAIALFHELDDRHGLTSSLATLALCGATYQTDTMVSASTNLGEVIQDTEQALKIAHDIDQRSAEAYALFQLALCLGSQGEYGRALETVQLSLDIAEEIEHSQWQTAAQTVLGGIYYGLLAYPRARSHFEQALTLAREIGSLFWTRIATGYLASTLISQGDLKQAELVLNGALDPQTPAQTMAQRLMWCAQVELVLAQGNSARALEIANLLITSDPNTSHGQHILRVSKLRGEALKALQQPIEAESALAAARTIAKEQGARPMQWGIYVSLGNLYQAQGRHKEAEQVFATARTIIEELATTIEDESLRDNFMHQATRILPPTRSLTPARVTKQAFGGLSKREREVALLIAQGKSNREIADMLVLSERTIESHVSSILFKLDYASRTQIATWAIEKGLTRNNA